MRSLGPELFEEPRLADARRGDDDSAAGSVVQQREQFAQFRVPPDHRGAQSAQGALARPLGICTDDAPRWDRISFSLQHEVA